MQLFQRLNSIFSPQPAKSAADQLPSEAEISDDVFQEYSFVISNLFTYFNELPEAYKRKFVKRVFQFRANKKFHFIGLEKNQDIEILVSASAIQVTFGLNNYMMSFFKDIHILADAYQTESEDEYYVGHVAPDGIYLSFKHFLYGYLHKGRDNTNVAVHEMAHALVHNNVFAQYGADKHFRLNYEKFSSSTGAILADVITNRRSYLRSYAFSNIHEFWAVSVEAFFVNPLGLKSNMPELYEVLCRVLNQDPSTENKLFA
ncbi:MAG TPA: zinc-dependent peptidase [Chitinophagaceae bacterium]